MLYHISQIKAWDRHHTTPSMVIAINSIARNITYPIFTYTQYLHWLLLQDCKAIEKHWDIVIFNMMHRD